MIRGGLRTRLIGDSARLMIIAGLEQRGWFDPTIYDTPPGIRTHRPLHYIPRPVNWDVPIDPNALAISTDDITDIPQGLGGDVEDNIRFYVDLYAQDDQFGWHVAQDIRDLLLGKMPALGRTGPVIDVYDFRLATPAPFTTVDIETVTIDRAASESRDWQNHWFMIRFDVSDDYADEYEAVHASSSWSPAFAPAWQLIQSIEVSA